LSALRVEQLEVLVTSIREFGLGAQLQEIGLTENFFLLQHYGKGAFTIGLELRPLEPQLGYFFVEIPKRKLLIKPIILFLRAHARNLRLIDVILDRQLGRVVRLVYSGGANRCEIELRLIPHGMNILIDAGEKKISLFPAKALPISTAPVVIETNVFTLEDYLDAWMIRFMNPNVKIKGSSPQEDLEKKRQKELRKKTVLIGKLEEDLGVLVKPWLMLGEYLKVHQSLEVPEEWTPMVDPGLPVNANMQRCFEKHKQQERRKEQIQDRIAGINAEVLELASKSIGVNSDLERSVKSVASELLTKAKAKGRKLKLAEGVEAVFGKSAKDNLALLRRAQGWDLWLHLRDLPGAHLVIRRPRQKIVEHQLLLDAAQWLLRETLGKKKIIEGDRYDVIVTECRFVRPIKGDKLGRVNFQNEMTLTLRVR
jgi:hypothetical protein